jgi:hypothetical protein
MCLFIKDGCHIEIAKKDITTFKEVLRRNNCWEPACKGSETYEYNKILTARKSPFTPADTIEHLQIDITYGVGTIYEGFHSRVEKTFICNKICIIPKGSEICYGENNDIVSLHIIVFKNKLCYLKYKLNKLLKKKVE